MFKTTLFKAIAASDFFPIAGIIPNIVDYNNPDLIICYTSGESDSVELTDQEIEIDENGKSKIIAQVSGGNEDTFEIEFFKKTPLKFNDIPE
jgi:hypothetical protein